MWIKILKFIEADVKSIKSYGINFDQIYNSFGLLEVVRDEKLEEHLDTMYWIYQFKKELREKNLAKLVENSDMKLFIQNFAILKTLLFKKRIKYYNSIESLYQRFFGYPCESMENKLDTVVFDLKKKQLYSNFLKNSFIDKFLTNGTLLGKLRIFSKNKKKNLKIYGYNIKKFFFELDKRNYVVEVVGCKNHTHKIIKLIKKNYKLNSIFIFTPKRSFFIDQFKKLSSIKKRLTKKNSRNLKI